MTKIRYAENWSSGRPEAIDRTSGPFKKLKKNLSGARGKVAPYGQPMPHQLLRTWLKLPKGYQGTWYLHYIKKEQKEEWERGVRRRREEKVKVACLLAEERFTKKSSDFSRFLRWFFKMLSFNKPFSCMRISNMLVSEFISRKILKF